MFRRSSSLSWPVRSLAFLTLALFLPAAIPAPLLAAANGLKTASTRKAHMPQGFHAINGDTWTGKMQLALAHWKLERSQMAADKKIKPAVSPQPSMTLLDEVGHVGRPIPIAEVQNWKYALKTRHLTPMQAARLHISLGEYLLGHDQHPSAAIWHFQTARHLVPSSNPIGGLAAYDKAMAIYWEGAYGQAADSFRYLSNPKTVQRGYSWQSALLWSRRAAACAGYHAEHEALGIPEPPSLDPLCAAASLAASLRALKQPYSRSVVLAHMRVTGEGSTLQDAVKAGPALGVTVRPVTATDAGLIALPKPVIAFVEHDHFVSVVKADKKGVSYLCSDCGPWPGGQVNLTWQQCAR